MKTTPSIFADDSTVYAKGLDHDAACRELITELHEAQNWAESLGMSFNPDKSECLTISSKRKSQQLSSTKEQLKMKGNLVTAVTTHKHLGIVFNRSFTWSDQISTVRTKCARRMGILRKMSHLFSKKIIKKIYLTTIRPIMEYGCAVWSGGNTTGLKEIQDRFCKTHGIPLPDLKLQKRFDFLTLILFFKIRNKNVRNIRITGCRRCSRLQPRIISVRTDVCCLLCPSQVHCPVFYREL